MISSVIAGELLIGLPNIPTGSCTGGTPSCGGTVLSGTVINSPRGTAAGVDVGGAARGSPTTMSSSIHGSVAYDSGNP